VGSPQAQAANYPFCTIEPNLGRVDVPDVRLGILEEINDSVKTVANVLEFVDIAGLVEGAHKGEGLGNKFLANIRECDAIVHVVRCFDDEDVVHVSSSVQPVRDIEIIDTELAMADLDQVQKRLQRLERTMRAVSTSNRKEQEREHTALLKIEKHLDQARAAREMIPGTGKGESSLTEEEEISIRHLNLLTMKKVVYLANVEDEAVPVYTAEARKLQIAPRPHCIKHDSKVDSSNLVEVYKKDERAIELAKYVAAQGAKLVCVSASFEAELGELDLLDRELFLQVWYCLF
jgi:GTP-binding protein YchF